MTTETAWVIKRDDGMYFTGIDICWNKVFKKDITDGINFLFHYLKIDKLEVNYENVIKVIDIYDLTDCKPQKIQISEVCDEQ